MPKFLSVVLTLGILAACAGNTYTQDKGRRSGIGSAYLFTQVELSDPEPLKITPEVLEGLQFLYRFITEVEFVLCLEGQKKKGKLIIDGFRLARMQAASVNSVRYEACTADRYIGTAHNHPPLHTDKNLCYQSEPDRRSFRIDSKAIVDLILCGDDQFFWVLKDGKVGNHYPIVIATTDTLSN